MMVIPGWDVAVQANWGFVRVRWLSHAAVGILIPLQFRTVLQIEQIETIDWHVCGICLDDLDAALRLLCQRLLVYKMDIFSVTMSGLAVRIEITFLQTTRNYTNSTSSAWTSPTSCAIQIPWVQADSSSFSLSSVQLSIVSPCFIEYCKRTMGKFASTCQAVELLFHKLEYVGIPTCFYTWKIFWSLYEWLSGSACAGCKNFWKCNSEGLSALIFGLSAMSLGCCARRDSLVLKEIPQEATSFDNSWYSFGWSEVFCFLWAQSPNCFRLSWQV